MWWPNTPESKKRFGLNTYGPDVELEFVFDFMDRKHAEGKPFILEYVNRDNVTMVRDRVRAYDKERT